MSRIIPPNTIIVDSITGTPARVEEEGGLAVSIQDQHSPAFDVLFALALDTDSLGAATSAGDTTITLTDSTGFVDGSYIGIFEGSHSFFAHQIGAPTVNDIDLDVPVDKSISNGSTVRRLNHNMNVDGSVTSQIYQIGPIGSAVEIDITRVMGYIQDGSSMDDSLFGGIAALTKGILLRKFIGDDSEYLNYWHAKTNGELSLICFDFAYTDKAPAGSFGARFRNTYAGQNKHGVTIRLMPNDILEIVVQDDLTDLEDLQMMAQGHYVTG